MIQRKAKGKVHDTPSINIVRVCQHSHHVSCFQEVPAPITEFELPDHGEYVLRCVAVADPSVGSRRGSHAAASTAAL